MGRNGVALIAESGRCDSSSPCEKISTRAAHSQRGSGVSQLSSPQDDSTLSSSERLTAP
ncbi:hypothetical protein D3C86_2176260 [compost metagenome]